MKISFKDLSHVVILQIHNAFLRCTFSFISVRSLGIFNLWICVYNRQPLKCLLVVPAPLHPRPHLVFHRIYPVGLHCPVVYCKSDGMLHLRLFLRSLSISHFLSLRSFSLGKSATMLLYIVSSTFDRPLWWGIKAFNQQPCWWFCKQCLRLNQAFRRLIIASWHALSQTHLSHFWIPDLVFVK